MKVSEEQGNLADDDHALVAEILAIKTAVLRFNEPSFFEDAVEWLPNRIAETVTRV